MADDKWGQLSDREKRFRLSEKRQERAEKRLSEPAGSLGEAIKRVPSQMGRNFADRVSQEFGTLGSATVAAIRTPGARTAAFTREVSRGVRGAIADALGSGQIGRYLADKVRSGIRYDKDPQKNFERLRAGLIAASQDFQQIKGTISSVNKQTRELALVVKQVAEKVNRIEREQSVQQRLIDQLKQAADENKGRVSGLKAPTTSNKPKQDSTSSLVKTAADLTAAATGGAVAGGAVAALSRLKRLITKFGIRRSIAILSRKMGARLATSLVAKLMVGAVGGAVTGGIVAAIMVAWTLKDINDAINALEEADREGDDQAEQEKLQQLIEKEERQARQNALTGRNRLRDKYRNLTQSGRFPTTQAPRTSSVTLAEKYARMGTNMEKQQFLAYGQLPRGFENVPGHMGILGSPGAVMARGAMPLGQFGGGGTVGGYGGMPSVTGGGGGYGGGGVSSSSTDGPVGEPSTGFHKSFEKLGGVNPFFRETLTQGAIRAFGDPNDPKTRYELRIGNAVRHGDPGHHGRGNAADVQVYDRKTRRFVGGNDIFKSGLGNPHTYNIKLDLARAMYSYAYEKYGKEAAERVGWGGTFVAKQFLARGFRGLDTMHVTAVPKGQRPEKGRHGSIVGGPSRAVSDWLRSHGVEPPGSMGEVKDWKSRFNEKYEPQSPSAGINQPSSVRSSSGGFTGKNTQRAGFGSTYSGVASTYDPRSSGYATGGMALATGRNVGGRWVPNRYSGTDYEAAIQLSIGRKERIGVGNKVGYALVEHGGKRLIVRINDNGPLTPGRIIDLNTKSMQFFNPNAKPNSGLLKGVKVSLLRGTDYTPGEVGADWKPDVQPTQTATTSAADTGNGSPSGATTKGKTALLIGGMTERSSDRSLEWQKSQLEKSGYNVIAIPHTASRQDKLNAIQQADFIAPFSAGNKIFQDPALRSAMKGKTVSSLESHPSYAQGIKKAIQEGILKPSDVYHGTTRASGKGMIEGSTPSGATDHWGAIGEHAKRIGMAEQPPTALETRQPAASMPTGDMKLAFPMPGSESGASFTDQASVTIKYANQNAKRHYGVTANIERKLKETAAAVYGPGTVAEIYSGGQLKPFATDSGWTSTRHNIDKNKLGRAADVRFYDKNGKLLDGSIAAQYWAAKKFGGVGATMAGGGVHLDEHTNRASHWFYRNTPQQARNRVLAGVQGQLPKLVEPATATSAESSGTIVPMERFGKPSADATKFKYKTGFKPFSSLDSYGGEQDANNIEENKAKEIMRGLKTDSPNAGYLAKIAIEALGLEESGPEKSMLMEFIREGKIEHDPEGDKNAWCATFVASIAKQAGMPIPNNSSLATNWSNWGTEVPVENIKAGDVFIKHRGLQPGKGAGQEVGGKKYYGHLSIATGRTKIQGGKTLHEVIAGNQGDRVDTDWVEIDKSRRDELGSEAVTSVRRGPEISAEQRALLDQRFNQSYKTLMPNDANRVGQSPATTMPSINLSADLMPGMTAGQALPQEDSRKGMFAEPAPTVASPTGETAVPMQPQLPQIPLGIPYPSSINPATPEQAAPQLPTEGPAIAGTSIPDSASAELSKKLDGAASTSPQASTAASAGSDGSSGGGGSGGAPGFRNHPESQAASPGSQGLGSFGRCYLMYEWR